MEYYSFISDHNIEQCGITIIYSFIAVMHHIDDAIYSHVGSALYCRILRFNNLTLWLPVHVANCLGASYI